MNAIEQMMQAFGAGSAQQMAAIFGSPAAAEGNAVDFANQFATALENSQLLSSDAQSPWRLSKTPALDGISLEGDETPAEFFSDISGLLPTQATTPTLAEVGASLQSINGTLSPEALAEFAGEKQAVEVQGIPGLQLVQLTGAELTDLIESGQLQPLSGDLPNLQASQNDLFLFAAGGSPEQPVRLLPLAQLEPLVTPDGTIKLDAITKPELTTTVGTATDAANGKPAQTGGVQATPVISPEAAAEASSKELASKVISDQTAASSKATASETFKFAEDAKDVAGHGAQANAAKQTADKKQDMEQPLQQVQQQKKEQQSAQNAVPNAEASNKQATTAAPTASTALASAIAPKPTPASAEQKSADKPSAEAKSTASTAATAMPKATSAPSPITWTPEHVAGAIDGTLLSSETFSGGLTGLRGESSFMNGMSLMGGKTSPELSAHVAKQINMQVTRAVNNGTQEFNMRLNPSELGGLKIKMSFTEAGKVSAHIMAERPETLELLQREARGIERAVEAGGHKVGSEGISFSLDQGDGQSAGKAFAEAIQEEKHAEKLAVADAGNENGDQPDSDEGAADDLTDLAVLEQILSRVSPETGLDVRV